MIDFMIPLGLAAFALVSVVRKLGRVAPHVIAGRRPWACDACMSTWANLLGLVCFVPVYFFVDEATAFLLLWTGGAVGVSLLVFTLLSTRVPKDFAVPGADPIELPLKACEHVWGMLVDSGTLSFDVCLRCRTKRATTASGT